jgi:hypothetical protein
MNKKRIGNFLLEIAGKKSSVLIRRRKLAERNSNTDAVESDFRTTENQMRGNHKSECEERKCCIRELNCWREALEGEKKRG